MVGANNEATRRSLGSSVALKLGLAVVTGLLVGIAIPRTSEEEAVVISDVSHPSPPSDSVDSNNSSSLSHHDRVKGALGQRNEGQNSVKTVDDRVSGRTDFKTEEVETEVLKELSVLKRGRELEAKKRGKNSSSTYYCPRSLCWWLNEDDKEMKMLVNTYRSTQRAMLKRLSKIASLDVDRDYEVESAFTALVETPEMTTTAKMRDSSRLHTITTTPHFSMFEDDGDIYLDPSYFKHLPYRKGGVHSREKESSGTFVGASPSPGTTGVPWAKPLRNWRRELLARRIAKMLSLELSHVYASSNDEKLKVPRKVCWKSVGYDAGGWIDEGNETQWSSLFSSAELKQSLPEERFSTSVAAERSPTASKRTTRGKDEEASKHTTGSRASIKNPFMVREEKLKAGGSIGNTISKTKNQKVGRENQDDEEHSDDFSFQWHNMIREDAAKSQPTKPRSLVTLLQVAHSLAQVFQTADRSRRQGRTNETTKLISGQGKEKVTTSKHNQQGEPIIIPAYGIPFTKYDFHLAFHTIGKRLGTCEENGEGKPDPQVGVDHFIFVKNGANPLGEVFVRSLQLVFGSERVAFYNRRRNRGVSSSWNEILSHVFDRFPPHLAEEKVKSSHFITKKSGSKFFLPLHQQLPIGATSRPPLPWALISNADCYASPKWLGKLAKATWSGLAQGTNDKRDKVLLARLGQFALFTQTHVGWETLGLYDENLFPAYGEDVEIHIRAVSLGLGGPLNFPKVGSQKVGDTYQHVGMVNMQKGGIPYNRGNMIQYINEKWGVNMNRNTLTDFVHATPYKHPWGDCRVYHNDSWILDWKYRACLRDGAGNPAKLKSCRYGSNLWELFKHSGEELSDSKGNLMSPHQLLLALLRNQSRIPRISQTNSAKCDPVKIKQRSQRVRL